MIALAAIFSMCGGMHARTYRILSEGESLIPLRVMERGEVEELASARRGVVGHVATSGRTFHGGDPSQGELVMKLAEQAGESPA